MRARTPHSENEEEMATIEYASATAKRSETGTGTGTGTDRSPATADFFTRPAAGYLTARRTATATFRAFRTATGTALSKLPGSANRHRNENDTSTSTSTRILCQWHDGSPFTTHRLWGTFHFAILKHFSSTHFRFQITLQLPKNERSDGDDNRNFQFSRVVLDEISIYRCNFDFDRFHL